MIVAHMQHVDEIIPLNYCLKIEYNYILTYKKLF